MQRQTTVALALAALASYAMAQAPSPSPSAPVSFPIASTTQPAAPQGGLPTEELEKLLAPIALYPDVLVAQILPASTFPLDVVQAARWLRAKPDMSKLLDQKWDPSVLALCNYPEVIYMLDKDLDWTNALGASFLEQQQDVMNTIQDLRRRAQASGALKSTPQQTVVQDAASVRIVPAQENVVYVPQYNPQVVYVAQPAPTVVVQESGVSTGAAVAASAISFGTGLAMGAWLNHDCDWDDHGVVWCKPGYWGGWGHAGAVRWNDDGWAAFGPRRAAVVGDDGGAYVGPRGAAVWGDDGHGAAWRRPTAYGAPNYTGRYASYNRAGARNTQISGNRFAAGNEVNINRNNVNIDRGDRTAINRGGDRTTIGGDRSAIGGGADRTSLGAGRTDLGGADRASAFNSTERNSRVQQDSMRGSASRSQAQRQTPQRQSSQVSRQAAGGTTSTAFNDSRGSRQVKSAADRGSSSRGSSVQRSGGGRGGDGRGGGGRGGGGRGGGGGRRGR